MSTPLCSAALQHTHGVAACDLPEGHDGEHSALCDICLGDGYDDPSDRLNWEHDGESWVDPKPQTPPTEGDQMT